MIQPKDHYINYSAMIRFNKEGGYYYLKDTRLFKRNCFRISALNNFNKWYYQYRPIDEYVLKKAVKRGIQIHYCINLILQGKMDEYVKYLAQSTDMSKTTISKISYFEQWWQNNHTNYEVIFTERMLVGGDLSDVIEDSIAFFGTIDALIYNKATNKLELIDWKSSKPSKLTPWKYHMQLWSYAQLLTENFQLEKDLDIFFINIYNRGNKVVMDKNYVGSICLDTEERNNVEQEKSSD